MAVVRNTSNVAGNNLFYKGFRGFEKLKNSKNDEFEFKNANLCAKCVHDIKKLCTHFI